MLGTSLGLTAPYRLKRTIALLAQASLRLDFTRPPLDSRVTFTRASGGTSFRPVGRGTLVNLLTYSNDLASAGWGASAATVTGSVIKPNAANAIHRVNHVVGTVTSGAVYTFVTRLTAVGYRYAYVNGAASPNAGQATFDLQTGTVVATASGSASIAPVGDGSYLCVLTATSTATSHSSFIQVNNAAVATDTTFTGDGTSGIAFGGAALFSGVVTAQQIIDNGGIPLTFTAADNLLRLDTPGDPIQLFTAPANVPRFDYDPVSGAPKGLLIEEQRTNNLPYSNNFLLSWALHNTPDITPASALGPDGAMSLTKFRRTTTSATYMYQGVTKTTTAAPYTSYCYMKAGTARYGSIRVQGTYPSRVDAIFDLQSGTVNACTASGSFSDPIPYMLHIGGGVYFCGVTATTDTSTAANTLISFAESAQQVDGTDTSSTAYGYLGFAQNEAGAFPTSHIPTAGATATRAADVASINTLTPWFNQTEGTLFAEVIGPPLGADRRVASLHYGLVPSLDMVIDSGGSAAIHNTTVAALATLATGAVQPGSIKRIATTLKQSDWVAACGGASSAPGTASVSYFGSGAQSLWIGGRQNASGFLNGHIRRLAYFNRRLSNLDLQGLTR